MNNDLNSLTSGMTGKGNWPYDALAAGTAKPAVDQLAAALATAQGAFDPIHRGKIVTVTMKSGGKYTFAYAPLESILRAVTPALSANGLSLSQDVIPSPEGAYVETTLFHSSGQKISNRVAVFQSGDGAQAYGSGLTYARRYGVTLLLCICADDDDDGNASEGNSVEVVKQPATPRVDPRVKEYVDRLNKAFELGIDGPVLSIVEELSEDQDLKVAVWGKLPSGMRSQIKAKIDEAKA